MTTRNLGAAYPMVAEPGLGHRGVLVGDDLLGGSFVFDPFELYAQGIVSNPNMIVFGQIGRGKSAFVKTYLWRQAVFGRRAWVVDPKGEYGALAEAWGVRPIALRPGGKVRLNPLDAVPATGASPDRRRREALCAGGADGHRNAADRQLELLASLATACLGRALSPRERVAIDLALGDGRAAAGRADAPGGGRRAARPDERCRGDRSGPTGRRCSRTGAMSRSSCAGSSTATSVGCSTGRRRAGSTSTVRSSCSTCRPSTTPQPSAS